MTSLASFAIAEPSVGISLSQRPTNKARSIISLLDDIGNRREEGRGIGTERGEGNYVENKGGCGRLDKISGDENFKIDSEQPGVRTRPVDKFNAHTSRRVRVPSVSTGQVKYHASSTPFVYLCYTRRGWEALSDGGRGEAGEGLRGSGTWGPTANDVGLRDSRMRVSRVLVLGVVRTHPLCA